MSDENAALALRVVELETQLSLTKQMLFRVHNTLMMVTKGQEVRTVLKPGSDEKSITFPVPDDSPEIYLTTVSQPIPRVSPILGNNGQAFRRNGSL